MVEFLIGLIMLVLLVNIRLTMLLMQKNKRLEEEISNIYEGMEEFVVNLEEGNNGLYEKMVAIIKEKDRQLDKRMTMLEETQQRAGTIPTTQEASAEVTPVQMETDTEASPDNKQEMEHVTQLYKQGFSPQQIAKVLKLDHGAVELMVNMIKSKLKS